MGSSANTLKIVLGIFGLSAFLSTIAGCTVAPPWSELPSPADQNAAFGNSCPKVVGEYLNTEDAGNSCSSLDAKACSSLTFYLFSEHVPEAAGVSNFPTPSDDWPNGTHVLLEQPTADLLRIVSVDRSKVGSTKILASKELDRKSGDFECQGHTIRLKPRVHRDFLLWMGRRTNTEYLEISTNRTFLEVQSMRQYESYLMWLVGGTMREERSTHRWKRVE